MEVLDPVEITEDQNFVHHMHVAPLYSRLNITDCNYPGQHNIINIMNAYFYKRTRLI